MSNTPSFRVLLEKVTAENQVYQTKLPVQIDKLSPVFSKPLMNLHYNILYRNYVKKALAGEGEFQLAGAKLHTLFFEQFQAPTTTNNPSGNIKALIDKKFTNYSTFKAKFTEIALDLHGSGWVYLATNGTIKTIPNHKIVDDVCVLVDCWEHSYQHDYGADKEKYLKEVWRIVDWSVINNRLDV